MTLEKFSEQVEQYSRRQMEFYEEVELSFESKCDPSIQLTPVQVLSCFRIIQEALTNVLKHAHAQNIRIEIRTAESNLYISVIDDGVGMCAGATDDLGGNGIPNMKRRAEELSGRCEFGSAGGNGTKVTIVIPLCNAQPS
jgi:NarL family two-component system sensor histidine kinase LiaS